MFVFETQPHHKHILRMHNINLIFLDNDTYNFDLVCNQYTWENISKLIYLSPSFSTETFTKTTHYNRNLALLNYLKQNKWYQCKTLSDYVTVVNLHILCILNELRYAECWFEIMSNKIYDLLQTTCFLMELMKVNMNLKFDHMNEKLYYYFVYNFVELTTTCIGTSEESQKEFETFFKSVQRAKTFFAENHSSVTLNHSLATLSHVRYWQ